MMARMHGPSSSGICWQWIPPSKAPPKVARSSDPAARIISSISPRLMALALLPRDEILHVIGPHVHGPIRGRMVFIPRRRVLPGEADHDMARHGQSAIIIERP